MEPVERESELDALTALLDRLAAGRSRCRYARPIVSRRLAGLIALALVPLALAAPAAAHTLYVGGVFGPGVASLRVAPDGSLSALAGSPNGTSPTNGVALTPDGEHLFATSAGNGEIYTYDVNADGSLKATGGIVVPAPADPDAIAISPDGRHAYVTDGEPEAIRVYAIAPNGSLTEGKPAPLPGADFVEGIAISPDGRQVFAATANAPSRIYGFDVAADGSLTPQAPPFVAAAPGVTALTIGPNGHTLYAASAGAGGIQAFALEEGTLLQLKGSPYATGVEHGGIAVSPLGTHVFAARTGTPKGALESFAIGPLGGLSPAGVPVEAAGRTEGIAVTPGGSWVYSAGDLTNGGVSTFAAANGLLALASPTPFESKVGLPVYDSLAVSPNQPPTASFLATQEGQSDSVRFDASGSSDRDGTIARYDWEFGDGTGLADGGPAPLHTYPGLGTYTATVTLTDAEGCSTTFVFTGQSASCNGSAAARAVRQVVVADPPPRLGLFVPRRQKLGPTVTLRASCDEACTLTARAQVLLTVPGTKAKGPRKLKVRPKTRRLVPGARTTVRLALPRASRNAAAAGLAVRRAKARVRIAVTATDSRGQRARATRTGRLLP